MLLVNGLTYKQNLLCQLIEKHPGKTTLELMELSDQLNNQSGMHRLIIQLVRKQIIHRKQQERICEGFKGGTIRYYLHFKKVRK